MRIVLIILLAMIANVATGQRAKISKSLENSPEPYMMIVTGADSLQGYRDTLYLRDTMGLVFIDQLIDSLNNVDIPPTEWTKNSFRLYPQDTTVSIGLNRTDNSDVFLLDMKARAGLATPMVRLEKEDGTNDAALIRVMSQSDIFDVGIRHNRPTLFQISNSNIQGLGILMNDALNVGIATLPQSGRALQIGGDTGFEFGDRFYFGNNTSSPNLSADDATTLDINLSSMKVEIDRVSGSTGQIIMPQYSVVTTADNLPAYTFKGDLNTGLFRYNADDVGLSAKASWRLRVNNGNVYFNDVDSGRNDGEGDNYLYTTGSSGQLKRGMWVDKLAPYTINTVFLDSVADLRSSIDMGTSTDDQVASEVPNTAVGNLSSTNVQAALEEHQADIDALASGAGDGVATAGAYDSGDEEIDVTVAAPGSSFSIDVSGLADDSEIPTNTSDLINDSGFLISEVDGDPTNEYNSSLTLSGTTLNLTDGGGTLSRDLSVLQDGTGTDDQNLTVGAGLSNTSIIQLENGTDVTLQEGANIDLTESGNTIIITSAQDGTGTDDQNISGSSLVGTNLTIGIENGTNQVVSLASLQDGTGTDDQSIGVGNGLSNTSLIELESGGFVTLVEGAGIQLTEDTGTDRITITNDEPNTDEQDLFVSTGSSETSIINVTNGASVTLVEGVGIQLTEDTGTDEITITASGDTNTGNHDFYQVGTSTAPTNITNQKYTYGPITVGTSTNLGADFNLYASRSTSTPFLRIQNAGSGDTPIHFDESGGTSSDWSIGKEGSSDNFIISQGATLGEDEVIEIENTTGRVTINKDLRMTLGNIYDSSNNQPSTNGSIARESGGQLVWGDVEDFEEDSQVDYSESTSIIGFEKVRHFEYDGTSSSITYHNSAIAGISTTEATIQTFWNNKSTSTTINAAGGDTFRFTDGTSASSLVIPARGFRTFHEFGDGVWLISE